MKKLPAPIFITIAGILTLTAAQPVLAEDTEVLSVQTENAADQNQENDLSNADVISCGALTGAMALLKIRPSRPSFPNTLEMYGLHPMLRLTEKKM